MEGNNRDPIRDRLIDSIATDQSTWDSLGTGFKSSEIEDDARLCIAEDLFRMGHVLQSWGSRSLATEASCGSSFDMAPSSRLRKFSLE